MKATWVVKKIILANLAGGPCGPHDADIRGLGSSLFSFARGSLVFSVLMRGIFPVTKKSSVMNKKVPRTPQIAPSSIKCL